MKSVTAIAEHLDHVERVDVSVAEQWPSPNVRGRAQELVLVVDDEPMVREILAHVLRVAGYRVLEAVDALEAQRLAEAHGQIDLLITDLSMPKINGLELALWFRTHYPETRVMIASGSLWELNQRLCESEQIACLSKPFTPLELTHAVQQVLR